MLFRSLELAHSDNTVYAIRTFYALQNCNFWSQLCIHQERYLQLDTKRDWMDDLELFLNSALPTLKSTHINLQKLRRYRLTDRLDNYLFS